MSKKKQKRRLAENFSSIFDPNGSYTGTSQVGNEERPVQDADDL